MARNKVQLKSMKVCAFRSFRRETEIEFGESVNVLVGKNGAGKSSVVAALEFALCSDMISYKPSDLKALRCYYEYKGSRNNPTYVEVCLRVFENQQDDGRELVIRREFVRGKVSLKIDNVPATMKDLIALGFRWKDFVVKQGQVAGISNASPVELLQCFEDLSGAVVLRKRTEELTSVLDKFGHSLERVAKEAEEVQSMVDFVNKTQGQRKQLKAKEDQKRAIDYIRFVRKNEEGREKLERLKSEYQHLQAEEEVAAAPIASLNAEDDSRLSSLEKEATELSYQLKFRRVKEESLEKQNRERFLDMETYKAIISDLQQKVCVLNIKEQCGRPPRHSAADVEYKRIREEYLELVASKPIRDCTELKYKQQIARCKSTSATADELKSALISAVEEYDQKISEEVKRLQMLQPESNRVKSELRLARKNLRTKLQDVESYIIGIKEATKARSSAHREVNDKEAKLRTLGIQHDESKADLLSAEEKTRQSYLQLHKACGIEARLVKQVLEVINNFRKTSESFEEKCHGFLIDWIDYDARMGVAVETALERKMFSVIVADVHTVLEIQSLTKLWIVPSIEFVCLEAVGFDNEVTEGLSVYENVKRPLEEHFHVSSDCPNEMESFVKEIVLRLCPHVALCKRPTEIRELLEDFRMMGKDIACATLKGFKVFTEDSISHCVHPEAGQVRECYAEYRETYLRSLEDARYICQSSDHELQDKRKVLKKCAKIESEAQSKVNLNICRLNQGRKDLLYQETEVIQLERQEEVLIEHKLAAESNLDDFKKIRQLLDEACLQVDEVHQSSTTLCNEMATDPPDDTKEHQAAIAKKLSELQILRAAVLDEEEDVDDENMLSQSQGRDQLERDIDEKRDLLASAASNMRICEAELAKIRTEISGMIRSMKRVERQIECLKTSQQRLLFQRIATEPNPRIQALEVEISALEANLQETFKEPWKEDLVSEFMQLPANDLYKQYGKILADMRKMDQRCAILVTEDQIESYQEEIDRINILQQEYEVGRELVRLIRSKLSSMLITFLSRLETEIRNIYNTINSDRQVYIRLVSKTEEEFSLISVQNSPAFQEELVEGGINGARFVINGSEDEPWSLTELSGGQRSMISLAMILALQKLRPVPFLIFDEVDAALDKPSRNTLNNLICSTIGDDKQMICTTFRQELAGIASTFLHARFSSSKKTSVISSISKEAALSAVSRGRQ